MTQTIYKRKAYIFAHAKTRTLWRKAAHFGADWRHFVRGISKLAVSLKKTQINRETNR